MLRRKTATYALLALYEIAEQSQDGHSSSGIRAGDIALKHNLPKAYAAKILSQLASVGILHSDRGPRGGFRLNRRPETITLFDVFDGVGAIVSFEQNDEVLRSIPPAVQLTMSRITEDAHARLRDLFSQMTLADLLTQQPVALASH
ncbi:MAG TPA: Rrf2 family transcriptional regulator [Phycisphaerae bacterium]|nr:Rrf2 family transcriptional regulator [Phycisphaerae bacterium]